MTTMTVTSGASIATTLELTSSIGIATEIMTLHDLLAILAAKGKPKSYAMLCSTAALLEKFLGAATGFIPMDTLATAREDFRDYLVESKYQKNSIRSYLNYLSMLLKMAKQHGWIATGIEVPTEWEELYTNSSSLAYITLVRYFARKRVRPSQVTEEHLTSWIKQRVDRDYTFSDASQQVARLRRLLVKSGRNLILSVDRVGQDDYCVGLSDIPEGIRTEIEALVAWKTAEFCPDRPRKAKIRAVTGRHLVLSFCQMYGYAQNIDRGHKVNQLLDLLEKDFIERYVTWLLAERGVKGKTVVAALAGPFASVQQYPGYGGVRFTWLKVLTESIPQEDESESIERKEAKYLSYETVAAIPKQIRTVRLQKRKNSPRDNAIQVRNELLMEWLVTLPWRQRNIREFRINSPKPNLVKSFPSLNTNTKIPGWAIVMSDANPTSTFWQFNFRPNETKTGRPIQSFLPKRLISILEEYLACRHELLKGTDPGTLFLNLKGKSMHSTDLANLVSELTLRHGGRVVTPHLFRDIFAYMYLEKRPEDYLTLSKLLWHRDINTTIQTYGRRFNESAAIAKAEEVLWENE